MDDKDKQAHIVAVEADESAEDHGDEVYAPTYMDGTLVDAEEAAEVHAKLVSGEMTINIHPDAMADMEKIGMTPELFRELLIQATKKRLS